MVACRTGRVTDGCGVAPMNSIHIRVLTVAIACVVAFIAGAWTARLINPPPRTPATTIAEGLNDKAVTDSSESQLGEPTPLFFAVRLGENADPTAIEHEVQFASASGVRRFIVAIPWSDEPDWEQSLDDLIWFTQRLPEDHELWLQIELSPTAPPAQQQTAAEGAVEPPPSPAPSVGDPEWRQDARARLTALFDRMQALPNLPVFSGFVLSALENGWWTASNRAIYSENESAGFSTWLAAEYADDAALQAAWGDSDITLADATPPEFSAEARTFFLDHDDERPQMDFLRYLSESTADAIEAVANHVRSRMGDDAKIFATYGYSFALANPDSGQFALDAALDNVLDGVVAPVALVRRGLGDPGGFTSPADTVVIRGKEGVIVDTTRTGLGLAGGSNASESELILNDVLNVQRRNFALAAIHGWRVAWADEQGQGNLNNPRLWSAYKSMMDAWPAAQPGDTAAADTQLLVVVDEPSFFVQRPHAYPEDTWLAAVRDVVLRAGLSARFVLMSDLLAGRISPAPLNLFANVYRLSDSDRARLHELLSAHDAAALWRYAPGYVGDESASVENISLTTGITVKSLGEGALSNSVYAVSGNWIQTGGEFGLNRVIEPLFYVEDEDADVLANYAETERASAAIKFMDNWTSVLVCEPVLPVDLLREVADILELPLLATRRSAAHADLLHGHSGKIVVHSADTGERTWDLGSLYDVVDLLDPQTGWQTKRMLTVPLVLGETLLLDLQPAQAAAPIAEPPPLVEEDLPPAEE